MRSRAHLATARLEKGCKRTNQTSIYRFLKRNEAVHPSSLSAALPLWHCAPRRQQNKNCGKGTAMCLNVPVKKRPNAISI